MKLKLLLSSIAISIAFSSTALAIGGDDPIPGIDIIIKKSALCHPHCDEKAPIAPSASGSGTSVQGSHAVKKVNSVRSPSVKMKQGDPNANRYDFKTE
ncbi:hypothetical protein [Amphritea sp.]|uniref:hypothetical protein n=1 Tax=Amphritea sp. TaxID=1872502 RepID=UPI003A91AB94